MSKEGEALKPQKLLQQAEKTVATSAIATKVQASSLVETCSAKFKPNIIKKFDKKEIYKRYWEHIFSEKHLKKGIRQLGNSDWEIFNKFADIIEKTDATKLLKPGTNRIKATISGYGVEISVHLKDGIVKSVNGFKGWSSSSKYNIIIINGNLL